jgi:hypothetical protein
MVIYLGETQVSLETWVVVMVFEQLPAGEAVLADKNIRPRPALSARKNPKCSGLGSDAAVVANPYRESHP